MLFAEHEPALALAMDSSLDLDPALALAIALSAFCLPLQVRKCIPTESLVSVLRDTPATKGMENAIEVASFDETLILSSIPDIDETCEVINEILAIAKRVARGSSVQRLELMQTVAPDAANHMAPLPGSDGKVQSQRSVGSDTFAEEFNLNPEDWLIFLRDHAQLEKFKVRSTLVLRDIRAVCP
jgi:hypothetical protein